VSTPIIENIAVDIKTAINEITTGNDYNYTLSAVRPKRVLFGDEVWDDLDVLIIQSWENARNKVSGAYGIVDVRQQFDILAIVIESDKASTSIDTKNNKIAADMIKKLRIDPQRSDNAHDTEILAVDPFAISDKFSGILVQIEVWYRVKQNDPYKKS